MLQILEMLLVNAVILQQATPLHTVGRPMIATVGRTRLLPSTIGVPSKPPNVHGSSQNAYRTHLPVSSGQLAERIIRVKALPMADDRQRELVQKTILGSLNRAKETIVRVEAAGVVSWRLA